MENKKILMREKWKIVDSSFAHTFYSTMYQTSKYFDWVRVGESHFSFYTDRMLSEYSDNIESNIEDGITNKDNGNNKK